MVVGPLVGEEVRQLIGRMRTPSLVARSFSDVAGSKRLGIAVLMRGGWQWGDSAGLKILKIKEL